MNWYLKVLKQYADFNGRARRKEYWMFALFNVIFGIVAFILDHTLGISKIPVGHSLYGGALYYVGPIYLLYGLAVLIPGIAVSVRRLHDIGKSGWWILIAFIPLIGAIWFLVYACTDSQPGENKWGKNPKGIGNL